MDNITVWSWVHARWSLLSFVFVLVMCDVHEKNAYSVNCFLPSVCVPFLMSLLAMSSILSVSRETDGSQE